MPSAQARSMPLWNARLPVKGSSRQPYPSEMRHCVVSSGKQKASSVFDCARAGSTSLTQSSTPSRAAARKRADFFPYFACFMRRPARPLRFVCIPFPLSAVVHCMQAAVQKDPAGLFPCRVLQYCYLRNLKRSRNCFRRLFCAGASAMAGFAGFGAEAGRGSGFLRFTICSSSSK